MSEANFYLLANGLDAAVKHRDLPDPQASPTLLAGVNRNSTDSTAYISALRTRMTDLGYLGDSDPVNRSSQFVDQRLIRAIECFQLDVGGDSLKQDGWAGPKTWRILQSLASFEDCQEPEHWQIQTPVEDCEAVARAVWLRLYVMGFFSDWKKHKLKTTTQVKLGENPSFREAYNRFWQFARHINLLPVDLPEVPDLTLPCLQVLFNYDVIIRRLADVAGDNLKRHRQALEAIVRVELWLQGYDCVPGNPGMRKRPRGKPGQRRRGAGVPRMQRVITGFWADNPDLRHDASRRTISAELFAAFRELLDTEDNPEQEADYVIDALNDSMKDGQGEARFLERIGDLASSIWDGIKRIGKLVARLARGIVKTTSNLLKNLARFVAREARRYFHIVVRAVDAVQGGFDYLRNTVFPPDLSANTLIGRGVDFDHRLLLHPECSNPLASDTFDHYQGRAQQFHAACVIVGELVGLVGYVLGRLTTPVGWLVALLALGRIRIVFAQVESALDILGGYEVTGAYRGALLGVDVA